MGFILEKITQSLFSLIMKLAQGNILVQLVQHRYTALFNYMVSKILLDISVLLSFESNM